jgi:peroxiredoxin
MLEAGQTVPDARVYGAPGEEIALSQLYAEGAVLFFFYLFDWSST